MTCRAPLAAALLLCGCNGGERATLALDLSPCLRLAGQGPGEAPAPGSCGHALRSGAGDEVPLCIAVLTRAGPATLGAWWDAESGELRQAASGGVTVEDSEEVRLRLFFLGPGAGEPAAECAGGAYSTRTACSETPHCVLGTQPVTARVRAGQTLEVRWGEDARPCAFDCAAATVCGADAGPAVELPDGRDNDCDGLVDEPADGEGEGEGEGGPLPVGPCGGRAGEPCSTGLDGICAAGTYACTSGALVCTPDEPATEERCNGLDDDCDGATDEELTPPPCEQSDTGVCAGAAAARTCAASPDGASWSDCAYGPGFEPGQEASCDGLDNDCDGATDEDDPEGGAPCDTTEPGVCAPGTERCVDAAIACVGDVAPSEELKGTARDEDCDGLMDEGFSTLLFLGRTDLAVMLPATPDLQLDGTSFTLEAWIRPAGLNLSRVNAILSRRSTDTGHGWLLGVTGAREHAGRAAQRLVLLVGDWPELGAGEAVVADLGEVAAGAWHHVAATFSLGDAPPHRASLFLDGRLVGRREDLSLAPPGFMPRTHARIGADAIEADGWFLGEVADLRVSTGVRYGGEAGCAALADACFEPEACLSPDEATLAHWPLDEGDGLRARDLGPLGLHGTIPADGGEDRWEAGDGCAAERGP